MIESFPKLTSQERVEKIALELEMNPIDVINYGKDSFDELVREDAEMALRFYLEKKRE